MTMTLEILNVVRRKLKKAIAEYGRLETLPYSVAGEKKLKAELVVIRKYERALQTGKL